MLWINVNYVHLSCNKIKVEFIYIFIYFFSSSIVSISTLYLLDTQLIFTGHVLSQSFDAPMRSVWPAGGAVITMMIAGTDLMNWDVVCNSFTPHY